MLIFEALQAHQQTSALRAGIDLKLFTAIAGGACTPEARAPLNNSGFKDFEVHHAELRIGPSSIPHQPMLGAQQQLLE
jgi:hypothetical protein